MTIKVTFNGASFSKPGTYPAVKVLNLTGFPLASTGTVGVIGEAVGGQPGVLDVLEGPQIQAAKLRYKSGPIADALSLLVAPSNDGRIANGASKVIVYKANAGTQATLALKNAAAVPVSMVNLTSKNWGADENQTSVQVTAGSVLDSQATLVGTLLGPYTMPGAGTLVIKSDGTTYTYTSTLAGSSTAAAVVTDINNAAHWAPSKPVIASVSATGSVQLALDPAVVTTGVLEYGYMLADPSGTLDVVLGITGSVRGVRGSRNVVFKKGSVTESTLPEMGGVAALSIVYNGAGTCLLSVADTLGQRLLTTVCGTTPADNLSIVLGVINADLTVTPKAILQNVVDLINAHPNYTCSTTFPNPAQAATELDFYTSLNVELVAATLRRDVQDFVSKVSALSSLVNAARISNVIGTLAVMTSPVFVTGATDGSSTNTAWSNGFDAMKQIRANFIVPLLSADKGTLTVDTVNALASAHANYAWSAAGRSPRQVYASRLGSKSDVKTATGALNSAYVSLCAQDPKVFSFSASGLAFLDPWATACLCAGMQAGANVGEPITFKSVNVSDVRVRDGSWNPKLDFSEMIDAGVTFLEPMDAGGFRIVVGNTTYATDANFVYNRSSVVEAAGFLFYDLMVNLELLYTGTKARTGTATAIAATVRGRMGTYLSNDIIVGDDLNKGKGFKDLRVSVAGDTVNIDVTVTPVQGIDFILPTIYLADISQSA